jgi:hypothetical protein
MINVIARVLITLSLPCKPLAYVANSADNNVSVIDTSTKYRGGNSSRWTRSICPWQLHRLSAVPRRNAPTFGEAHSNAQASSNAGAASVVEILPLISKERFPDVNSTHLEVAKETCNGSNSLGFHFRNQSSERPARATATSNFGLGFLPRDLEIGWKRRARADNAMIS